MGTSTELDRLRARIDASPRNAQGHRTYDDALKEEVCAFAGRKMKTGKSLTSIAGDLALSADTLWGWVNRVKAGARGRSREDALPERAREFRAAMAALGPRAATTPYPPEIRALGLKHVQERRAQGASNREAANELGIANETLRNWVNGRHRRSTVRRVSVAAAPMPTQAVVTTTATLVVYGPAGIRIEGLDVAMVAALLKVLS